MILLNGMLVSEGMERGEGKGQEQQFFWLGGLAVCCVLLLAAIRSSSAFLRSCCCCCSRSSLVAPESQSCLPRTQRWHASAAAAAEQQQQQRQEQHNRNPQQRGNCARPADASACAHSVNRGAALCTAGPAQQHGGEVEDIDVSSSHPSDWMYQLIRASTVAHRQFLRNNNADCFEAPC